MPATTPQPYAAFRLNLEQQKKRAKELLQAVKSGEDAALQRLRKAGNFTDAAAVTLAAAQHCIARELRFANWAALQQHIAAMTASRATLEADTQPLDGDCRTMHIRCGHDIQHALKEAGLHGDFNPHINPYLEGPVTAVPDWLEQRARFIVDSFGPDMNLEYHAVLDGCRAEEQRLAAASRDYERVVLWFEHDRYDQFVLLRCLAWFAEHGAPPVLELVGPNDFPGATRFVGLGQLPPEALRLLWQQRKTVSAAQIRFGLGTWNAFRAPDPRPLAELVRKGTPLLPDMAAALHRHLQELPSVKSGLGLTQQLLLETLVDSGPILAGKLVGLVMHQRDPLPGLGDLSHDQILRGLTKLPEPLVLRERGHARTEWHLDTVAITEHGRAVLAGKSDWLALPVAERWVGGVKIAPGQPNWHWDERTRDLTLH